jgi:outer membrane protein OmpA-like peptidoglycan-associated protein
LIEQVPAKSKPITVAAGAVRAKGATRAERDLAQKRAEGVARFLRANGLSGTIRVRTMPVTVQNRSQDRRVDVTVRFTAERF